MVSRHKIIQCLETKNCTTISEISSTIDLSSSTIRYHLQNMATDGYVEQDEISKGWKLVELNQAELTSFLSQRRKRKSAS